MLARAARRKLRRDAFRSPTQLSEQLTLPWLCPAQMRRAASTSPITALPLDSRLQRQPPSLSPRHKTRSLATAADVQPSAFTAPFDGFMQPWTTRMQPPGIAKLESWDPANPLIVHDAVGAPESRVRFGIGGDPVELHQNLHACLRVGRMDRATAILERLVSLYNPSAPEVIEAHNIFLQAMFDLAEQNPTPTSMTEMEEWYDSHMVRRVIEPNADTFVTLLRASMTFLEGAERDNAIRKYLDMAQECGADVVRDINESEEFTDEEWDALIRFQPTQYKKPPPLEEVPEIQASTSAGYAALVAHGLLPNPAHRITPVAQKGYGLQTLKQSLNMFDSGAGVLYPHEMEGDKETKDRAYAYMRQLQLETDSTTAAIERWKAEDEKLQDMGIHGVLKSKPVQALMWQWYSALLPLVKKEVARTKAVLSAPTADNQTDECHKYGPYLEQCDPEKIAALTVSRVIQSCARGIRDDTNSLRVAVLSNVIGEDIEQEANITARQKFQTSLQKERKRVRKALLSQLALTSPGPRIAPKPNGIEQTQRDGFIKTEFPTAVRTRLGALALELLMQAATVTVTADDPKTGKQLHSTQPAFHHHTGFMQGKRVGWVSPHHEITSKIRTEPVHNIATVNLPMVFEPQPWTSFTEGGYYKSRGSVIRTKAGDTSQRAYAHSAISNGDMDKVLKGLDVLGKVPWQINSDVFTVMTRAWNAGEGIGAMVPAQLDMKLPEEPPSNASHEERRKWMKKVKEYENLKSGFHSQRCYQNFQLEIARAFIREEKIYFPHSVDFRGRAYPVPPLLNHIGADLARSLLRFSNGKELGTVGLQWLKVHLANLYGYDKASFREREQFAMDNLDEVYDSATNPLVGRRWWTRAEDPWQCLACCMELKNALDSPDPTRFISRLPVHQDGTCNGLQHYAALGGDHAGASQVNLEPSDRPQDIYTGVAELVKEMIAEDAKKGDPVALFVDGKITRKVVKRTVMTNVYGVTFMGAKLQVLDELKEIFPNFEETPHMRSLQKPALYIAGKIFAALGKIFNGAQEIQYWLGECGERITTSITSEQIKGIQDRMEGKLHLYESKYKTPKRTSETALKKMHKNMETFKTSIIWTTPLKMPVVQPYRKHDVQIIKTKIQEISVFKRNMTGTVDKRKQLQAFPPNFIHSLDATHMILSALKCSEMGLDFAAVHDSFWTHAADIPNLNTILRDAFVRMHSEDIIGRLAAEFKARYAGSMYRASIIAATPVGRKIAAWRKAHRGVKHGLTPEAKIRDASFVEVALEAKRQDLLNCDDPAKRKEGEEMVTPTSIWLANQDPKAMASFRLALLGQTKKESGDMFDEVKDKVLGAEAEANKDEIAASGVEPADISNDPLITSEAFEAANEDRPSRHVSPHSLLNVWLPLTFPPVPKKGNWDVTRLRESKYFFS
ncbi:DNA/RNA polymerase [Lentithecium fluviatile CBS 122367]|uniref:DNA-directed RNA polymerase n=1 Tax=Lentithecium fluviatile CBS 122367 TaxID=1168545 RepID=A0A6G1JIX8_9PLEO|nr:DNA/RNA polymerase [Lentithecium fluviatile CBS 122367]